MKSPDRPANAAMRAIGIKDDEPPITDAEFELYSRFSEGAGFFPREVLDTFPPVPPKAERKTRAAIRRLLADPRLPQALDLMERARAQAAANQTRREAEEAAAEVSREAKELKRRLELVDEFHANQLNDVRFRVSEFQHVIGDRSLQEASLKITTDSYSDYKKNVRNMNIAGAQQAPGAAGVLLGILAGAENTARDKSNASKIASELSKILIRRSLVAMKPNERATLRMADVLVALGVLQPDERLQIAVPIVWNDGECDIDFDDTRSEFRVRAAMLETLRPLLASGLRTTAGACERLNQAVRSALDPSSGIAPDQRETIERYLFNGNRWMTQLEAERTSRTSPSSLSLGVFTGTTSEFRYDLRESLITVAPPGSGKSQAHVLRNLLYLQAPAVVLDVKGEMLRDTRRWREANVGKTYAFTPQSPGDSLHYNPVDDIRSDPELAWDDARNLADLLVVPSGSSDGDSNYFEGRARDMITTALLDVALSESGADRSMAGVVERLYLSEDDRIVEWCKHMEGLGNEQLRLQATALRGMPAKQREGIFDSARRQLEIWQSPAIRRITTDTNFDISALRDENATLYLAIALEDIKKYASVLRVLIGQSLRKLYREKPESDARTITFFLDELPRLGRMDVIEESLDVGRGFGVRLWMFCQNVGQLRTAYPNAQGMMSNCAIRCFMNPDEDSARWMAENLGMREGLLDGARKPLIEAHQLTGPEFANQIVVFSRGAPPARLEKLPAHADPVCRDRMKGEATTLHGPETEPSPTVQPNNPVEEAAAPPEPADPVLNWDDLRMAPEAEPARHSSPTAVPFDPRSQTLEILEQVLNSAPPSRPPLVAPAPLAASPTDVGVRGNVLRSVSFDGRLLAIGGMLSLLLAGAAFWIVMQTSELIELRKQRDAVSSAERTAAQLASERERLSQALKSAEQDRDRSRADAISARSQFQRESEAHAATKGQFAALQRQLDAARSASAPSSSQVMASAAPVDQPSVQREATTPTPHIYLRQTEAPVTDCDRLAANPNDVRKLRDVDGIRFPMLSANAQPAVQACRRALSDAPGTPRLMYQLARALQASGDVNSALPIFNDLVRANYPAAFDNAGQYYRNQQRWDEAAAIYRRGAALNDPDSLVALADMIRAGRAGTFRPGEDRELYERAANIGHAGARKALAEGYYQ